MQEFAIPMLSQLLSPAGAGMPMMGMGLGQIPGMGGIPGLGKSPLESIPGFGGTNKIPGEGLAKKEEAFAKGPMLDMMGKDGANPMAMMMGMEAMKSMSAPKQQAMGPAPSAPLAPQGRGNVQLSGTAQALPVNQKVAGLAQLLFGGQ